MVSGPVPKEASTRRRRNKTAGARTLHPVEPGDIPTLPTRPNGGKWADLTLQWWADLWSSPMSAEYDSSDRHGLFMLADLMDQYWQAGSLQLAAEIRQQRQAFGLTPLDRRRLQWEIDRGDEAQERTRNRQSQPEAAAPDPRKDLAG